MDLNKIRQLLWERDHYFLSSEAAVEGTIQSLADEVPGLLGETQRLGDVILSLCDALSVRRAMEPKHSDPEHECPECDLLAEIRHSETYKLALCRRGHDWVDARNKVVQSGEMCLRCGAIR